MNHSITKINDSLYEFAGEVSYEELKPSIEKELVNYQSKVQIDGFRKGKAPLNLIRKMYGEAIEYKAAEKYATDYFWEKIEKEEKKPISTPTITDFDFSKEEGLKFKVTYEVIPDIEVKDYLDLEIKRKKLVYDEKLADKEIERLRKYNSNLSDADVVENENFYVTIRFKKIDDSEQQKIEPFDQGIDLSYENIKEDLKNLIIGKKVGDKFEYIINEKTNDKEITHKYECEILKIQKYEITPLSEEKIKLYSQDRASNEEEFRKLLIEEKQNYFDEIAENDAENTLINTILNNNPIEVPPKYVDKIFEELVELEKNRRGPQSKYYLEDEKYLERLREKAKKTAHFRILVKNIARINNIEITEEYINTKAEEDAKKQKTDPELLKALYKKPYYKDMLLEEKVLEFIKSRTRFVDYNAETEETVADLEKDEKEE